MKTSQKNKQNLKIKKEVERILKANCDCQNLEENDPVFFGKVLFNLLKEADELDAEKGPEDFDAETNKLDFDNALEPESESEQFDVQGVDPNITVQNIEKVRAWGDKLEKFAEFMNDPDTQSLHKLLADQDKPGSLLRGVTRKSSDAITRIAGEISKLREVLNTYVILAPKKQRDTEQYKNV